MVKTTRRKKGFLCSKRDKEKGDLKGNYKENLVQTTNT